MQNSDMSSSYYQYYQPHFQNPNPNPSAGAGGTIGNDPQFDQVSSAACASAPPMASNYGPSDYANYSSSSSSSAYPPYTQNPEHVVPTSYASNPNPIPSSQPPHQPYSFPHLDSSYYPYDQNQAPSVNYDYSNANPNYNSSFNYSSVNSYGSSLTSTVPNHENSFGTNSNFGGYGDQGQYDAGVYKYNAGKVEPYDGRGGRSQSGNGVMFDDYGRPINIPSEKEQKGSAYVPKIVKATPKVEEQQDAKGSVQKFRVKLLSEGVGQSDMDVLCQVWGISLIDINNLVIVVHKF